MARTVRDLRASRGLSLDALAHRCGVSRSMISLIERGESSPTAVVLEKLAAGLDVSLASLFERPAPADGPIARHGDQPTWRDPGSGYVRRNVSPTADTPIQLVDVTFPPRAHVAYETVPRERRVHQQVWVLDGEIVVSVGADRHHLRRGDCLALVLDEPTAFENPTDQPTRYVVALVHEPPTRR
ncbi:MAG: XRE family transcriptional regulator [Actinomycetota bacterium]|nr:XRE family transcriptional regulator [Actinomycetota bacterium]